MNTRADAQASLRTGLRYRLTRALIARVAKPLLGKPPAMEAMPAVYVLEKRSLSDLVILDLVCEQQGIPRPVVPLPFGNLTERRRFGFLDRPQRWFRSHSENYRLSRRLQRLLAEATASPAAAEGISVIPVLVQWGRAPNRQGSLLRLLLSENWAVTSRLRRLLNLLFNRRDIVVTFGRATALGAHIGNEMLEPEVRANRFANALRQQLRDLRLDVMGPDFSHRRTLALEVATSTPVREALAAELAQQARLAKQKPGTRAHQRLAEKLKRRVNAYVESIVSNMTYSTMMVLERLLGWFWNRIYDGVELKGSERLQAIPDGHQLIYLPSHRSHVDYLLLSYLLFHQGRMIPHIVAGDNLNLPVIGGILRRGGAFFMRRSFRDDPLYGAVFSEYLYQIYRRGHSVEFFPEGGRSRTGRLLPARLGLLKMTLDHHRRGLPRPVTLVPVYVGYEKLIEGKAYRDQLRGAQKRKESLLGVFRNLRLTRQNFGRVVVNVGRPIHLDAWLAGQASRPEDERPTALGRDVMAAINGAAVLNAVNFVALVLLATNRLAIERELLAEQLKLYQTLLSTTPREHLYALPDQDAEASIDEAVRLRMVEEEQTEDGAIVSCDAEQAVLLTWYRNNVAHTLSVPALLACLVVRRRRPIRRGALLTMLRTLHPYLADELSSAPAVGSYERWLKRLLASGLLEPGPRGDTVRAPYAGSAAWYRLKLLSRVVMQSLERMLIVVALIDQHGDQGIERATLQSRSEGVARRLSRLYGLNAPEFFDGQLFNQFIDALLDHGQLHALSEGRLRGTTTLHDVMRSAPSVIDGDVLRAVLRACTAPADEPHQAAA